MTTGNPHTANLSHEPFAEACKPDETRTARLNILHNVDQVEAKLIGIGKQNREHVFIGGERCLVRQNY